MSDGRRMGTFAILLALAGCTQPTLDVSPRMSADALSATVSDTRLFAGQCLFRVRGEEGAGALILGAIVPGLIEGGIHTLAATMKAAGEPKMFTLQLTTPLEMSKAEVPACLRVVRGEFFRKRPDQQQVWTPLAPQGQGLDGQMVHQGIWLAKAPDLFIEIPVSRASDGSALFFEIQYVRYARHLGEANVTGNRPRKVVVRLSVYGPNETDAKNIAAVKLDLGSLVPGHEICYTRPIDGDCPLPSPETTDLQEGAALTTDSDLLSAPADLGGLISEPAVPAANEAAPTFNLSQSRITTLGRLPVTSGWLPVTLSGGDVTPVNIDVAVMETEPGNPALLFLGEALEGSKEELQSAAEQILLHDKRREAEVTAATNAKTNISAYFQALEAAEMARMNYDKAKADNAADRVSLSILARKAEEEANLAAIIAERSRPYSILTQPEGLPPL
jgi:hypothetical protein